MDEFLAEKDKSCKRRRGDQDLPLPSPDSDPSKKKRHDLEAPMPDTVNISDSEDTDSVYLPRIKPRPEWLKPILEEDKLETPEPYWIGKKKLSKSNLEGPAFKLVHDVSKLLPLGGPPGQKVGYRAGSLPICQTLPVSKLSCVLCQDAIAFCLRRLPAFCFKVTAFCFKTKLRFASRPSAFCSRTHRDLSQEGCVLSPRQLRFGLTAF
nr:hypothetical protein [Tanacetum cinerariifolium]